MAYQLIDAIFPFAEMNSYEDNNTDDREENAKDAACDCVIQFQKRLDYIFTNEADRQCEFDWWEGIKKEIQTIKYKP